MANKIYAHATSALDCVLFDGVTITSGDFGLHGIYVNRLISGAPYDKQIEF